MKNLAIILTALFVFSCTKQDIKEQPVQPKPETCDFGIQQFSSAKRIGKGKPVKPPKDPVQPVSPSGVLFLDFDGHVVSNTSWNMNGDIVAMPSGLDANEQQRIVDSVAYDYRCFNIAVTADVSKYNAAAVNKRMRLVLTETWSWYGSAGGTAYIGSFNWFNETPCFVFTSLLGYNLKNIQEAASHEFGHTLGLRHQAAGYVDESGIWIKTGEYNYGVGGIAPIMGVAYHRTGEWWIGYNSFGAIQDDATQLRTALGSNSNGSVCMSFAEFEAAWNVKLCDYEIKK